ncbi:PREDICTED: transcription initiation factor TFIID subunit 3 isoform X1 [Cyprinodon variegatus]|uniref:Transcription initiation factor TFIID subunit 3 n=1 Tax=Cyprinodon variegatus TaxID=28743 RepID=A0A3Q2CPQ7_CYPVA|nr:PREDICTED: transcription initiation factor TFIID subunit 3 isoform X1 [Cyprinodon variegatus]
MCENYARSLLRVSVAQICQALGWDAVQLTACDLLSDVLHRYIQQLAKVCHRYSELYGRTDPVLDDLSQAFRLMGVNLNELEDYVNNLEPVAFTHQTPIFPVSKNNVLQFPQPGVRDAEERKDYIPEYMPLLVSLQEAEEEEEEVPPDMGTSAEAMQVALEEEEDEMDEDEMVNDENHPLKRDLESPDAALGMMASKRPRMYPGLSPEWGVEPREPLSSLNSQRVPPGILPSHESLDALSPETPPGVLPPFRPQPAVPKHSDQKGLTTPVRKPKVSSPGRQRTKSPKGGIAVPVGGSPIHSPKPPKERKKSPGRTKSPKSPKSPKLSALKAPPPQIKAESLHKLPLPALSERMGKDNVHLRPAAEDLQFPEGSFKKLEPDNTAIEDSIAAVIARACAEREPDPFAFSSGSDSDSNGFSSPRRLTIMEPSTPKGPPGAGPFIKDTSTPLHPHAHTGLGNWTLDDSINEVVRRANQGGPSAAAAPPLPLPPAIPAGYVSSGSASPPTPEPLLKVFEKSKIIPPPDVKKKLKKELKTKMKKKEKPKEKDREKDKSKVKEKNKEKNKAKKMEFPKEMNIPFHKEFGGKEEDLFMPRDFTLPEGSIKIKSRDGDGSKKDKEKHKDKKKDKEKSKKDKDKKEKNKDRNKEDKQKQSALSTFSLGDIPPLFSPSTCLRMPPMLPSLAPILHEKEAKSKEKEKKKDKKEKKKKKDKDKEREKAKEKEREKEEKRKEKEKEKEKREKEREKEKEKIRMEKVKMETPAVPPSPVIPRLTLRVGAGQDKIVISKVVPNSEPKPAGTKAPAAKMGPGSRPRTPPLPPVLPPVVPTLPPPSPLPPAPPPPSSLHPPPSMMPPSAKTPVRSVVTETVSTYVIRDEWGNQIWICPGCNKPDDGSPMIGCDDCDDWYHWPCVGILTPPPEDQPWFCVKCSSKKKDKKHKKKKHKPH